MTLKYLKLPLNLSQQVELLKNKGLIISSDELASQFLGLVSYHRLSTYFSVFERTAAPYVSIVVASTKHQQGAKGKTIYDTFIDRSERSNHSSGIVTR